MMSSSALAATVRVAVTVAVFALAFYGFLQAYPAGADGRTVSELLDLAYKSVQLCVGRFPDNLDGTQLPLVLQLSRFLVPLVTAWATLSVAWDRVRNRVRLAILRRRGGHVVVSGEGELAERLILGERRGGLIYWAGDRRNPLNGEVEQNGGAVVAGRRDGQGADAIGVETARAFVAAGDSDPENLEAAKRVMDRVLAARTAPEPLQLIARVDDSELHAALESRFNAREQRRRLHLRLASMPKLVARRMFLQHPIDRFRTGDGALKVGFVGWTPTAERMLERLLVAIHLRGGRKPEYVVFDQDAERVEASFRARRPGVAQIATVRFVRAAGDQAGEITRAVADDLAAGAFNALYVTLPEPTRALTAALALETRLERDGEIAPPIYVFQPRSAGGAAPGFVTATALVPFGSTAELGALEALLQEEQDEIARSIHEFYLQGRLDAGDAMGVRQSMAEWDELPESVRDENRLVADCYLVKLRDIGGRIVDGKGAPLRYTVDEVEALARAEHDRWMAAKLLDGWTFGEPRDDARRLHPDIKPYDDLSEAIKDLDREQVGVIPRILAAGDQRAVRDYVLLVEAGPASPSAAATQLDRALQGLAASHPDRAVVLLGDLAHVGPLLAEARGKVAALGFVLREPAVATLETLDGARRDAVARALREADRLYACPRARWDEARIGVWLAGETHGVLRLDGVSAVENRAAFTPAAA